MLYKIEKTDAFSLQLKNILFYLSFNFSLKIAHEYRIYIEEQLKNLAEFPYLGKRKTLLDDNQCLYLISKKNIILYSVDEERKVVHLLYIASANENYLNLL